MSDGRSNQTEMVEALIRQLDRERRARASAEAVAEARFRELVDLNRSLDERVQERTTELVAAMEAATAAARAKRSFLAHSGDALETPMHAILGNLELIDRSAVAADDVARLQAATEAAERLAAIIDGLMRLAASEGRPFERMMELRSPVSFLDSIEAVWQRRLASRGQLLFTEAAGSAADGDRAVLADWQRLRAVADHVLDNVRAHAVAGRVTVTVQFVDGLLRLVITDSGPGIAPQHWESVLAPFFRLDNDAGSATTGVGIGLAVAGRLLESVGGSVHVGGAAPGGTEVTCLMPVERRSQARGNPPA